MPWLCSAALLLSDADGTSGRVRGRDCGSRLACPRGRLALHWECHIPRLVFLVLELELFLLRRPRAVLPCAWAAALIVALV